MKQFTYPGKEPDLSRLIIFTDEFRRHRLFGSVGNHLLKFHSLILVKLLSQRRQKDNTSYTITGNKQYLHRIEISSQHNSITGSSNSQTGNVDADEF